MNLSWTCTRAEPAVGKKHAFSPALTNRLARVHARIPRNRKKRCNPASEVAIIVDEFKLVPFF